MWGEPWVEKLYEVPVLLLSLSPDRKRAPAQQFSKLSRFKKTFLPLLIRTASKLLFQFLSCYLPLLFISQDIYQICFTSLTHPGGLFPNRVVRPSSTFWLESQLERAGLFSIPPKPPTATNTMAVGTKWQQVWDKPPEVGPHWCCNDITDNVLPITEFSLIAGNMSVHMDAGINYFLPLPSWAVVGRFHWGLLFFHYHQTHDNSNTNATVEFLPTISI